jgi:hypothetical protein
MRILIPALVLGVVVVAAVLGLVHRHTHLVEGVYIYQAQPADSWGAVTKIYLKLDSDESAHFLDSQRQELASGKWRNETADVIVTIEHPNDSNEFSNKGIHVFQRNDATTLTKTGSLIEGKLRPLPAEWSQYPSLLAYTFRKDFISSIFD